MDHAPATATPLPQQAWKQADRLFLAGDAAAALQGYETAAGELDDPRLRLRAGQCHHALNDPAKARCAYALALEKDARRPATWLMLGLAYYDEGDLPRATGWFDRVLEQQPENHAARNMQALIRYLEGDQAGALAQWEQGLTLSSHILARILVVLEQHRLNTPLPVDEAPVDPGVAPTGGGTQQPAPTTRSYQRLMAMCRRAVARKDFPAARQCADRLAGLWPHHPESHFAVGFVALEMEHYEAALAAFRRAIRFQRHAELRRMAGPLRKVTRAFLRQRREELAGDPYVQSLQALALIRLGRTDAARSLLVDLPVMGPETYGKFYALALCALAEGQIAPARRLFEYALDHYAVDTLEISVANLMDWTGRHSGAPSADRPE